VLELNQIDVAEIATALSTQTDSEDAWLIHRQTGEIARWSRYADVDGANPVDIDDLDLVRMDPLPVAPPDSRTTSPAAGWERAMRGQGALRHFRAGLRVEYPELVAAWHEFADDRAARRALDWLTEHSLVSDEDAFPSRPSTRSRAYPDRQAKRRRRTGTWSRRHQPELAAPPR
jgi:hypothetical protein